ELEQALFEAADAVNRDVATHAWVVPYTSADAADVRQDMQSQPEGAREWRVPGHGLYAVEAALLAVWWSDFLGRRHLRLLGRCRWAGAGPAPPPAPAARPASVRRPPGGGCCGPPAPPAAPAGGVRLWRGGPARPPGLEGPVLRPVLRPRPGRRAHRAGGLPR